MAVKFQEYLESAIDMHPFEKKYGPRKFVVLMKIIHRDQLGLSLWELQKLLRFVEMLDQFPVINCTRREFKIVQKTVTAIISQLKYSREALHIRDLERNIDQVAYLEKLIATLEKLIIRISRYKYAF